MAEKHANIEELVYDDHNFNQHTAEGMELLEKSIRENKFGRSILIDKDNRIIAGNGIVEAATKTGTKKIRVIETDGDELIAVKRKDLSLDSQEGRRLALADNATSAANLKWDENELKNAEKEWGVSLADWGGDVSPDSHTTVNNTEPLSNLEFRDIYYTPEHKPNMALVDCVDMAKFNAKVEAIENSALPDEMKAVMRLFAYRFIKIDFESVANYYAFNATDEEQKIMERLRLVLVDGSIDGFISDDIIKINQQIVELV